MTGKSHKFIGIATGVAISIYGYKHNEPMLYTSMLTAPMGAMLPDIDHDKSRLGSARSRLGKLVMFLIFLGIVGTLLYYRYILEDIETFRKMLFFLVAPTIVVYAISKIDIIHDALNFTTKHRGIMHTLVIPVAFLFSTRYISKDILDFLVIGLCGGYLSHIVADCLTARGCPILFPITTKNINLTNVATETTGETILAFLLSAVIVVVSYVLL